MSHDAPRMAEIDDIDDYQRSTTAPVAKLDRSDMDANANDRAALPAAAAPAIEEVSSENATFSSIAGDSEESNVNSGASDKVDGGRTCHLGPPPGRDVDTDADGDVERTVRRKRSPSIEQRKQSLLERRETLPRSPPSVVFPPVQRNRFVEHDTLSRVATLTNASDVEDDTPANASVNVSATEASVTPANANEMTASVALEASTSSNGDASNCSELSKNSLDNTQSQTQIRSDSNSNRFIGAGAGGDDLLMREFDTSKLDAPKSIEQNEDPANDVVEEEMALGIGSRQVMRRVARRLSRPGSDGDIFTNILSLQCSALMLDTPRKGTMARSRSLPDASSASSASSSRQSGRTSRASSREGSFSKPLLEGPIRGTACRKSFHVLPIDLV